MHGPVNMDLYQIVPGQSKRNTDRSRSRPQPASKSEPEYVHALRTAAAATGSASMIAFGRAVRNDLVSVTRWIGIDLRTTCTMPNLHL